MEFPEVVKEFMNLVLMWIGFGTVCGLLAKGIMPGRDPGGTIATLSMGIAGSLIGCGICAYFTGYKIDLLGPLGFVVATAGAFLILFFYRLLGGYFFVEGDAEPHYLRRRRRRRRSQAAYYD
jgi:uncharacterized membrane protein YeaQ/YmgE (transglycosylase-associated protein family)